MSTLKRPTIHVSLTVLIGSLLSSASFAVTPYKVPGDLKELTLDRPGGVVGIRSVEHLDTATAAAPLRGWDTFIQENGGRWRVWLDRRSGLPTLVSGAGIAWLPGPANDLVTGSEASIENLETLAREFLEEHSTLLGSWAGQAVLDREASVLMGDRVWQITFRQEVGGVPVEGARYDFHVAHGNLVSFGAARWAEVRISAVPTLSRAAARERLNRHLVGYDLTAMVDLDEGSLHLLPVDPERSRGGEWTGAWGQGYGHRLVWRFSFADPDRPETWVGEVDAHSGEVFAFFDDTDYVEIRGDVNPVSDDGDCARGGCPEPGYPMPFADFRVDGGDTQYAGDFGVYECAGGGSTIETTLHGRYFKIYEWCATGLGHMSETAPCGEDLNLGVAAGTNCDVAWGASAGNTDAARTAYYHLNRVAQKARFWMPGNAWTESKVDVYTNSPEPDLGCSRGGSWGTLGIRMPRAMDGCSNAGQNRSILVHEWGHGLDDNDEGGPDSPNEGYADVVAILETRDSCLGRGFYPGVDCSGFGDPCLSCTGAREMDWDARQAHTPATPSGFIANACEIPGPFVKAGPCGRAVHCESHVPSEAMFDLATRDLPGMGIDRETAWQLVERLWYESRHGSGGDAYTCSLPNSDGCLATSWYNRLRVVDDDDGNLDNGTPHAAAIFSAFDRHDIACGGADDEENQNSSICPAIATPTSVSAMPGGDSVTLSWDAVANASLYRVYRSDLGCDTSSVPIVETPETSYTDDALASGFTVYYRVVAVGANRACEGAVSACVEATVGGETIMSWGVDRINQRDLPLDGAAGTYDAGAGANVYIMSTGIRYDHELFGGRANYFWDVDPWNQGWDCNGIGTHDAGTVHLIAGEARIWSVRQMDCSGNGRGSLALLDAADRICQNGLRPGVVHMAVSGGDRVTDAIARSLIDCGFLVVVGAGNGSGDACSESPARVGEALTIGATSATDTRAAFSGYGTCVDLFAPGASIISAWNTSPTATHTLNETGASAAHAAGVVAVHLGAGRCNSPADCHQLLVNEATEGAITDPGPESPNRLLYVDPR